jgi:hypothetical protein
VTRDATSVRTVTMCTTLTGAPIFVTRAPSTLPEMSQVSRHFCHVCYVTRILWRTVSSVIPTHLTDAAHVSLITTWIIASMNVSVVERASCSKMVVPGVTIQDAWSVTPITIFTQMPLMGRPDADSVILLSSIPSTSLCPTDAHLALRAHPPPVLTAISAF